MRDESLMKVYKPQSGGWERLNKKIDDSEEKNLEELVIWKNMVAALVIGFLMLPIIKNMMDKPMDLNITEPQSSELLVAQGDAVSVPQSIPGVRFYWLFIDKAHAE